MLINTAIAFVVIGHFAVLLTQHEFWPFSYYPMYADLRTAWSYEALRVAGVTADGSEVDFVRPADIAPFSAYGLHAELKHFSEVPDHARQLPLLLTAWRDHYNQMADAAGRTHLMGLRLYRVTYELDRRLDPKAKDHARIMSRELMAEVP
jgi:hypothetical protein